MPTIVVTSQVRNVLRANIPTASAITNALRTAASTLQSYSVPANTTPQDLGAWVGTAPRIVRWHDLSLTSGPDVTAVAWVYSWTDGRGAKWDQYVTQTLQMLVTQALHGVDGGFQAATFTPYNATINGPLSWWQSGQAANTQTRDVLPPFSMLSGSDQTPRENLTGPGTLITNANTPSPQDHTLELLKSLGVVIVVGMALYYGGPLVRDLGLAARPSRASRPTPRRSRR